MFTIHVLNNIGDIIQPCLNHASNLNGRDLLLLTLTLLMSLSLFAYLVVSCFFLTMLF